MRKFLWNITWIILRPLLAVFCRFEVRGLENANEAGKACVFAVATHSHTMDPYIVGASMPFNCCFFPVRFMTKSAFFKMPVIKQIVKAYGAFPVVRGIGLKNTLETPAGLIKQGQAVGIFVEGKISSRGELRPAKPGAAALSIMTGAPIIPVALKGTNQVRNLLKFLFGQKKISVVFGQSILPPNFLAQHHVLDKEIVDGLTQKIHREITRLYTAI